MEGRGRKKRRVGWREDGGKRYGGKMEVEVEEVTKGKQDR